MWSYGYLLKIKNTTHCTIMNYEDLDVVIFLLNYIRCTGKCHIWVQYWKFYLPVIGISSCCKWRESILGAKFSSIYG